ncbi:MAG TPA: pyridoxal-phosphate dependent enzyme [Gemmataceae bacterium]|jgi:1-aminocyclopropane-1-carboxylate deaminase/D-cysteine desulfhydrase-like pyridoxal-dependent ACC family enzyme
MSCTPLTVEELRRRAARLPRATLAHLPTPLEKAPRFAGRVGDVQVFVKRDDCTGLLFGGNKVRHAEFLLADAVHQGCDVLVWGAGVQSNNCRVTAAACARLGLECRLFLSRTTGPTELQGNLLLDHLVGAKVQLVDAAMGPELNALLADEAAKLRSAGRRPYVWHPPRTVPLAAVSYALAAAELADDLRRVGVEPAAVYVSSSGSTGAGLALGVRALGLGWPVRSVGYIRWPWEVPAFMADAANGAAELMGLPHRLGPADIDYTADQIGADYGRLTAAGREALRLMATTEAMLLDPVYTARAAAELIADVRSGRVPAGAAVVFVHTGGGPSVFAAVEDMFSV